MGLACGSLRGPRYSRSWINRNRRTGHQVLYELQYGKPNGWQAKCLRHKIRVRWNSSAGFATGHARPDLWCLACKRELGMIVYCPHCGFSGTDEEVDEHRATGIHNDEPQEGSNLPNRPRDK